jgi:hypothetical protein
MSSLARWTGRTEALTNCPYCGAVHRAQLRVCPLCARAVAADMIELQREHRRQRELVVLAACVIVTLAFIIGWFVVVGQR